MVDPRFFGQPEPITLARLLAAVGAEALLPEGHGEVLVTAADEPATAGEGAVVLAANKEYAADLSRTRASVAIVSEAFRDTVPAHTIAVVSPRAHELFVDILDYLYPNSTRLVTAMTGPGTDEPLLEDNVEIGAHAVIGPNVQIGRNTLIGANTVIGAGVTIGRDCIIGANVTIYCTHMGNGVVVQAGARIGTEGFGWLDFGRANRKIPQLGRVIVQDRCEIGPNATVDRGALGDTVVGENSKLGNIVVIGHNSKVGRNCLLASTTGIAGTTTLGDGVVMGAGVGTSGHLSIGEGSIVYGRAAVTKDWPAGSKLAGAPAQDIKDFWKELAVMRRLAKEN
jgi:UDP-3-O-[3-hydroxymyristoyl] glucosamine N-acyltransferase